MAGAFACPSDCGWCCTHLQGDRTPEEVEATEAYRDLLREVGVHHCEDDPSTGLSLSPAEARELGAIAGARGLRVDLHPRTFLLETRRRLAVVLDWHLAHPSCPFHAQARCTVYGARPLVCRAFPVLSPSPRWRLAPACPQVPPALEGVSAGGVRLGAHFRSEARARRAVEEAAWRVDEAVHRLLEDPGLRFAKALSPREIRRRLAAYRVVDAASLLEA